MENNTKPKWDKWKHIPTVRAWEAVALSLNVEPERMQFIRDGFNVGTANNHLHDGHHPYSTGGAPVGFEDRLTVLERNLDTGEIEIKDEASVPCLYNISTRSFVAWALSIGWDIPAELSKLASRQESPANKPVGLNIPEGLDESVSNRLRIMIEVANESWNGVTPKNNRIPLNKAVAASIQEKLPEISSTMADDMASIIRPDWAKDRTWSKTKKP